MNELGRLQAVNRFLELEISKEKELQEIVFLTASICGTQTALINLMDEDTQHIIFKHEFDFNQTQREDAFCNHVISQNDVLVIPDAKSDYRFLKIHLLLVILISGFMQEHLLLLKTAII
ncbi:MAG: hypothetical protein EOO43_23750 [Flavobacterium sp.]|nr:MAG: hypothetical protein EOO43_23750 [Flavobacterium sp.]